MVYTAMKELNIDLNILKVKTKICPCCKVEKELNLYSARKKYNILKVQAYCKSCVHNKQLTKKGNQPLIDLINFHIDKIEQIQTQLNELWNKKDLKAYNKLLRSIEWKQRFHRDKINLYKSRFT